VGSAEADGLGVKKRRHGVEDSLHRVDIETQWAMNSLSHFSHDRLSGLGLATHGLS
jgi:hypothetical protein